MLVSSAETRRCGHGCQLCGKVAGKVSGSVGGTVVGQYRLEPPYHDEEEEQVEGARRDGEQDAVHARHLAQVLEYRYAGTGRFHSPRHRKP